MLISKNEIKTEKYWDLNFQNNKRTVNRKTDDLVNEISETLMDSVKIRLRADVPVGTYLSGGLDSSALTETVKRILIMNSDHSESDSKIKIMTKAVIKMKWLISLKSITQKL